MAELNDVLSEISETIKNDGNATVMARVKEAFVERELQKRTDALVKAFDKLTEARSDLKKIKPDVVAYDEDGKEVSASYSKAKIDERKKAQEKVGKIESAINAALAGDYSKVYIV